MNGQWKVEAQQLINLAIPTVIVQFGITLPPLLTASYVGRHLGSVYLDGFTLANLTGNLWTLSLISGLYSASDTLSPQAFGAGNFKEVGLLAIRGFAGAMILVLPINLFLVLFMDKLLVAIGQDEEPAQLASQWYQIYALALPFFALYNITWKFLSSQEIMVPLVVVLALTLFMLPFLLDGLVTAFGFVGSALAILVYQVSQVVLLIGYLWWHEPHQEGTWPGLGAWRAALEWKPLKAYLSLGMGGILSASEWIYWEILGLMVGTLGKLPLAIHTVPTQVISTAFMMPLGIGMALSIRLGQTLPRSVKRAKQLAAWTLGFTIVLVTMVSVGLYVFRVRIYQIFTTEQDVLDGCDLIWPQVVIYSWSLSMFAVCMGIASGLGMQWTLGVITFICLWIVGLPAVWYFAIYREGGIQVVWNCVFPPYLIMDIILIYRFYVADWDAISHEIRIRECIENEPFDRSPVKSYGAVDEGNTFLTEDEKKIEIL
jgi:multidrug resistance protein, MATE family